MEIVKKKNWSQDKNGKWWYSTDTMGEYRVGGNLVKCEQCGKYAPKISKKKNKTGRDFCSSACGAKAVGGFQAIRGKQHHAWKGGIRISKRGYVDIYMPSHPHAVGGKYVREHRLVMEKMIGRYLEPWEQVHHKNGIKNDNRIDNLDLISLRVHLGEIKCPYCEKTFLIK